MLICYDLVVTGYKLETRVIKRKLLYKTLTELLNFSLQLLMLFNKITYSGNTMPTMLVSILENPEMHLDPSKLNPMIIYLLHN